MKCLRYGRDELVRTKNWTAARANWRIVGIHAIGHGYRALGPNCADEFDAAFEVCGRSRGGYYLRRGIRNVGDHSRVWVWEAVF